MLLVGLTLHTLALFSFFRQARQETAYTFQIALTISNIFQIIARTFYGIIYYHLKPGVWFKKTYLIQWIYYHLTVSIENMAVTTTLFLALAMSLDRVFSLGKPLVYKNIRNSLHQAIAFIFCVLIGIMSSIYQTFNSYTSKTDDGLYVVVWNLTPVFDSLGQWRNAVRAIGVSLLLISNFFVIVLFRRYMQKIGTIGTNSTETKRRRDQQKTLVILALSGSFCTTISIGAFVAYYGLYYSNFFVLPCQNTLGSYLQDVISDFCLIFDVIVSFSVNKSFRDMIFKSVRCSRASV